MRTLALFGILILASSLAYAGAAITFHGRILDPQGNSINSGSVTFKIQVRSPGVPNCLLYEESRPVGMSDSDGVFVIPIGDGVGQRTSQDPGITIEKVFSNDSSQNFTSLHCNSGTAYQPASLDSRKLIVTFDDGSGRGEQALPAIDVNYVPFALHAEEATSALKLGTVPASRMMSVASGTATPLSAADFAELLLLVNGTSAAYLKPASIPACASGEVLKGSAGALTCVTDSTGTDTLGGLSCVDGKILKRVAGAWACADETGIGSESDPTVQAFAKTAPGAGLLVDGSNKLVPDFGTGAGKVVEGNDARLSDSRVASDIGGVVSTGILQRTGAGAFSTLGVAAPVTNAAGNIGLAVGTGLTLNTGALVPDFGTTSGKVAQGSDSRFPSSTCASGNKMRWDGSAWQCETDASTDSTKVLKSGDTMTGSLNLPSNGLTVGTTQLAVSGGKIGIGTASPGALATVSYADAATTFTNSTANQFLISNTDTTDGNLVALGFGQSNSASHAVIAAQMTSHTPGSRNADLTFLTTAGNVLSEQLRIGSNGNVGIGTAAPGQKLSVAGVIESTTGGIKFPDGSIQTTAGSGGGGTTVFTANGTWTKPASGSIATIECWGGGGGGGRYSAAYRGGGGGGGAYKRATFSLSSLGATETVTIGAGGAGTSVNGPGGTGGNSSFGSWVIAYGGAGGGNYGGGGGGQSGAGSGSSGGGPSGGGGGSNGTGGSPSGGTGGSSTFGGAGGGGSCDGTGGSGGSGNSSTWGGGGGAGSGQNAGAAGDSQYGGAGGGAAASSSGASSGGMSGFGGGGGAGSNSGNATNGSLPGGGGGGAYNGTSGSGGGGMCIVTVR